MSTADQTHVRVPKTSDPEADLCPHGYPEGRGCQECEFWERVDYEYDRHRDK